MLLTTRNRQQSLESVFKTNFHGPLTITRALLPKLRAKGTGTLLYIGSQAAWHADPSATGYCSSKAALGSESSLTSPRVTTDLDDPKAIIPFIVLPDVPISL